MATPCQVPAADFPACVLVEFRDIVADLRAEVQSDVLHDDLGRVVGRMESALCYACRNYGAGYDATQAAVEELRSFATSHGFALHEFAKRYEDLALAVLNADDGQQARWCNDACLDAYDAFPSPPAQAPAPAPAPAPMPPAPVASVGPSEPDVVPLLLLGAAVVGIVLLALGRERRA